MERYRNSGGESGVSAYEIGSDYILVKFSGTARTYRYSYRKAGQNHVENLFIIQKFNVIIYIGI